MWQTVKGVFGGSKKEKAGKDNDEKVKSKGVVEKGGKGFSNGQQGGGKSGKIRHVLGGQPTSKEEGSGIIRTEVDLPQLGSNSQKKLAFLLDNVYSHHQSHFKLTNPQLSLTFIQVLTEEECVQLIKETEDIGYEPALLNIGAGNQILETRVRHFPYQGQQRVE